jgi:hypothetical protein
VRDINGGEYFLQKQSANDSRDPLRTLTLLHFSYDEWNWQSSSRPQFREYCRWMKRSIVRGHPVMFVVFLLYMQADDYDHIMPAIGVRFKNEDEYDPDDILLFHNLFHERQFESKMKEGELIATRKSCRRHCGEGGCIPRDVSTIILMSE